MATIRVQHSIGALATDCATAARTAQPEAAKIVRRLAAKGNRIAANLARKSAGSHGKHYHKAFTTEARSPLSWEYGPDAARPQGGMSFEYGSRNQPPHLDLNKSADIVGPSLGQEAGDMLGSLFWPGRDD